MIGTIDIEINAAHPTMPLAEFAAFVNSPSHVRVRNVPRRVGLWELTKLYVAVTFPDNATRSVEATHNGALWTATVAGCAASGTVRGGFQVIADGVDEAGNAVTGYVLGVGDVRILSRDSTVNVDGITYPLKICEEMPADPKIGYCYTIDGVLSWYDGTEWIPLGGGSGDMSHADFAGLPVDDLEPDETGIPELCTIVNQIKNALRPAGAVALAALAAIAAHAASVETNKLVNLKGASNVVTRVDLSGLATASGITSATNALGMSLSSRLSRESQNSTNYTDALRSDLDIGEFKPWRSINSDYSDEAWALRGDSDIRASDDIFSQLDAATQTNAAQSAALASKASTNDVALSPVYSQTPTFSEWTFSLKPDSAFFEEDLPLCSATYNTAIGKWLLVYDGDTMGLDNPEIYGANGTEHSTELDFRVYALTATRTRTDIIGYTLGSQTNKVLASTNDLARASDLADIAASIPSTTSNIVTKAYVESLGIASGGIEDPVRHCTWVQCVTNGVFYWIVQEEP